MLTGKNRAFVAFTVLFTLIAVVAFIYSFWLLTQHIDETYTVETENFEVDRRFSELLTADDTLTSATGLKNVKIVPFQFTTSTSLPNYPNPSGAQLIYTAPEGRRGWIYPAYSFHNTTAGWLRYAIGVIDSDGIPYCSITGNINAGTSAVGMSRQLATIANSGDRIVIWCAPGLLFHGTVFEYDAVDGQPQHFGHVITPNEEFRWSPPDGKTFVKFVSDAARESWYIITHSSFTEGLYVLAWLNDVFIFSYPLYLGIHEGSGMSLGWHEGNIGTVVEPKDVLRVVCAGYGPPAYAPPQPTIPYHGHATIYFTGTLISQ